jgi:hypothetical protein
MGNGDEQPVTSFHHQYPSPLFSTRFHHFSLMLAKVTGLE